MKMFLLILLACLFTLPTWADRIVIQGRPIELIHHDDFFKFPENYVQEERGYHFVEILHIARVCYIHQKNDLSPLEMIPVVIEEEGQKLRWYCYQYKPKFFEIDF